MREIEGSRKVRARTLAFLGIVMLGVVLSRPRIGGHVISEIPILPTPTPSSTMAGRIPHISKEIAIKEPRVVKTSMVYTDHVKPPIRKAPPFIQDSLRHLHEQTNPAVVSEDPDGKYIFRDRGDGESFCHYEVSFTTLESEEGGVRVEGSVVVRTFAGGGTIRGDDSVFEIRRTLQKGLIYTISLSSTNRDDDTYGAVLLLWSEEEGEVYMTVVEGLLEPDTVRQI